jgi:hypothetical protein
VAIERGLNDPALHAAPASVHESHFRPTRRHRGIDVIGDNVRNVARREGVQIQLALDGNPDGVVFSH